MMIRNLLLFITVAISLAHYSLVDATVSAIILKRDFDGDGKIDVAYIKRNNNVNKSIYKYIISEENIIEYSSPRRDYIIVEIAKGYKYYMNFPFVNNLKGYESIKFNDDLFTCVRNKRKGFFALSEEGAIYILV